MLATVTRPSARTRTLLLSFVLFIIALIGAAHSVLSAESSVPRPVTAAALAVAFYVAEQSLVTIEFRRQSHSLTFAGVPLALGLLLLPVHELLLARLVGSLAALLWQHVSAEKIIYNAAAFCFEVAVVGTVLRAWLPETVDLDLRSTATLLLGIAMVDQLMSLLVLWVIRMHGGTLSRRDIAEVLVSAVLLSLLSTTLAAALHILIRQGIVGDLLALALVTVAVLIYRMYASASRKHESLSMVHDFVTEGVGAETVEQLAVRSLARIRQVLRGAAVELLLLDSDAGGQKRHEESYTLLGVGEDDQLTDTYASRSTDWVRSKALHHGEPTLATRGRDTAVSRWLDSLNVKDAMVVPLQSGADVIGTVTVTDRLGDTATFTNDDLKVLQTLTSHLAGAVTSARLMEKLSYEATHDSLTGLPNRALLSHQISALTGEPSSRAAVLLLDLDKFKEVNDILGHDVGDQLLVVIAERLCACMPANATVARLGGDEFAVLVPGAADGSPVDAVGFAQLAADRILAPVWFDEALLTPEVSIGIATSPTVAPENWLRCADTAMYVAKSRSESVVVYETSMDSGRAERLALVADLRVALDLAPHQFALNYQPQIDLTTGAVTSTEALVRWHHPTLGTLAPDRFIPLAEATGLIDQLTMHLLTTALTECANWHRRGHAVKVAVNLSARNLANPTVIGHIAEAIAACGAQPDWLILEITESSVMEDPEEAVAALTKIAELGVCVSLDDFGTGYSSLSYLQRLPVSELKIDRSFVCGLTEGEPADNAVALFRSITALGANLNMRVVAEGIETKAQLDAVTALGCQVGQGFLISRPLAATVFHAWLDDYSPTARKDLRLVPASA